MERAAQAETAHRKAPCKYLGVQSGDRYEPNPSKWNRQSHYSDGRKTHAKVCFEWLHVTTKNVPHRVSIHADNVLMHNRPVPHNPMEKRSTGFVFGVDFMRAAGVNTHAGIQYKGIVFDSERPDLKTQVPNGGLDIQDEPVFWSLPDGRVVCWSLTELRTKHMDELFESNTHEAYREVAKILGQLSDPLAPCNPYRLYKVFLTKIISERFVPHHQQDTTAAGKQ